VLLATPLIEAWGANVLRGHEGLETWIRRMEGEFAFLDARPLHAEQHDDWVRGHCTVRGRGKASSSEIEFELHHAVRFEGPRIAEFHAFLTPEGARAKTGAA
jgi:SnoaL-like domain